MFTIHMGIPEMDKFWSELTEKNQNGTATKKVWQSYVENKYCYRAEEYNK